MQHIYTYAAYKHSRDSLNITVILPFILGLRTDLNL